MLVQQLQADRGGERERRPNIVSEEDAGRRVPRAHAGDLAVQRAMQGTQIGGLEACLGWVAAARRAGAPEAAQCKSSLTTRPSTPDGGVGAAAAHLGDDGVQPKRMSPGALWEGQLWAHQGRDGKQPSHHEHPREPRQTPFRTEFRAQMGAAGRSHGRRRSPA